MENTIYNFITLIKSKTSLSIFNFVTNNEDIVQIMPNLYLGTINAAHNIEVLKKHMKYKLDCLQIK